MLYMVIAVDEAGDYASRTIYVTVSEQLRGT